MLQTILIGLVLSYARPETAIRSACTSAGLPRRMPRRWRISIGVAGIRVPASPPKTLNKQRPAPSRCAGVGMRHRHKSPAIVGLFLTRLYPPVPARRALPNARDKEDIDMQHAISPVGADIANHLAAVAARESRHAEIDRRHDAIRDEIEGGDWAYLEELLCNGPEGQRREFWLLCITHLMPKGADLMRGPLAALAAPLQEAVALGIDERVDREIKRDINESQEKPWRAA